MTHNRIKCQLCDWSCPRFRGRKLQYNKLMTHFLGAHEREADHLVRQQLRDMNCDDYHATITEELHHA